PAPPVPPPFPTRRSSDLTGTFAVGGLRASAAGGERQREGAGGGDARHAAADHTCHVRSRLLVGVRCCALSVQPVPTLENASDQADRKSTRLNSSHVSISY